MPAEESRLAIPTLLKGDPWRNTGLTDYHAVLHLSKAPDRELRIHDLHTGSA